ncbi:PP2C family serine/threonine-protein phosphatase [Streptomyces sp. RKCA744]|uniref:PP2C family protein-serine/threonine phosphatase n=1 Tax=Streptomyces sp. RKCA744 TaxID=2959340 RepID=UPI00209D035B|nr:protein phosphatase 2C domain-containing protein [Streptomyces sp. RKCA744]MCO8308476.1 protein phosphatase 2C domain-containing protein [Streptomyces sp. RKCA744]
MSQMPQPPQLSACPTCDEPPQSGDRYCDRCGADLSAAAAAAEASADRPVPPQLSGAVRATRPEPDPEDDYELAAPATGGQGQAADPRAAGALGTDGTAPPAGPAPETGASTHTGAAPGADDAAGTGTCTGTGTGTGTGADPRLPGGEPGPRCAACQEGTIGQDGFCERCGHAQGRERDHVESELEGIAAATDRGLRHHRNEDAFSVSSAELPDGSPVVVAVVCDGVSSATRPDDASAAAAHAANEALMATLPLGAHPQQAMNEAIVAAAEAVNSLAVETDGPASHPEQQRHQNAPACTIVSAVVTSDILTVGWVGDSRAYWVPDDRTAPPARLTEDDSWAAQMVAAGLMSEAEAYADERAHAITGWLGADAYELEPHTASYKPDRPGVVVVCTDGLWNYAESAEEMARAVPPDARARPLNSAQVLVGHALGGGGHDNVTVAVVPFPAAPGRAGSA